MEEHNQPLPCPIAGEPARIVHIGYALDLVSKLLDMMNNPEAYYLDNEAVAVDDLCNLQHHLVNAKHGVPVSVDAHGVPVCADACSGCALCYEFNDGPTEDFSEGLSGEDGAFIMAQDAQAIAYNTEPVGSPWEKAQAAEAEQMPADYWHGEMRAEAEAERQADAALELAAELALCDWEGWD